jgi:hypothetical protein
MWILNHDGHWTAAAESTPPPNSTADSSTSPIAPTSPARGNELPASNNPEEAFQQGVSDGTAWNRWFASLTDGSQFKAGALYWASVRSTKKAAIGCRGPNYSGSDDQKDWAEGCEAAKAKLDPCDYRRHTSENYRRGWNRVNAAPANTYTPMASPVSTPPAETADSTSPVAPTSPAHRVDAGLPIRPQL